MYCVVRNSHLGRVQFIFVRYEQTMQVQIKDRSIPVKIQIKDRSISVKILTHPKAFIQQMTLQYPLSLSNLSHSLTGGIAALQCTIEIPNNI